MMATDLSVVALILVASTTSLALGRAASTTSSALGWAASNLLSNPMALLYS